MKRLGSLKGIKIGQLAIPGFPFGGYRPDPRRKKEGSLLSSITDIAILLELTLNEGTILILIHLYVYVAASLSMML